MLHNVTRHHNEENFIYIWPTHFTQLPYIMPRVSHVIKGKLNCGRLECKMFYMLDAFQCPTTLIKALNETVHKTTMQWLLLTTEDVSTVGFYREPCIIHAHRTCAITVTMTTPSDAGSISVSFVSCPQTHLLTDVSDISLAVGMNRLWIPLSMAEPAIQYKKMLLHDQKIHSCWLV